MSAIRRSLFVFLALLPGVAFSQRIVTASAATDVPRFIAGADTAQMRVQITSRDRMISFESAWSNGNLLDWPSASTVASLPDGSYDCTVLIRDVDGNVTEKRGTFDVQAGHALFQQRPGTDAIAVAGPDDARPRMTMTAHDGKNGAVVSTDGDLSFRFGNPWLSKDREAMRLTADGRLGIGTDKPQAPLDVNGFIRTSKGIVFADGTVLSTAAGLSTTTAAVATNGEAPKGIVRQIVGDIARPGSAAGAPKKLTPRTNAAPDYQFKVDATGVHIGTTPAFGLDVFGNASLQSNLNLAATTSPDAGVINSGGNRFIHNFGTNNTFVGTNAGSLTLTTTEATENTALGASALTSIAHGNGNTAIGAFTLTNNQGDGVNNLGWWNTALGEYALWTNTLGSRNTALGSTTLYSNSSGFANVAIGNTAMQYNTTGAYNIAIGVDSMHNNISGNHNIEIGWQFGLSGPPPGSLGNYNIYLGDAIGNGVSESNVIRIGHPTNNLKTYIAAIRGKTTGNQDAIPVLIDSQGQLGTVSSSRRYKFDISDMSTATDDLMRLRPVTFRYLAYGDNAKLQYGLIAEEVAEVYPELVARNADGEIETVMYQFLAPMLLNEVQKQHRTIEEQKKTIESLQNALADLATRVGAMEKKAGSAGR